jgi:subtilisin-like proprotein convertase family protein
VSFIIPLIPAGDSVVISADMIGCCNEPCTRNRFVRDGFAFSGSYLNGCGTSPRNITVQNVLPRHHLQQEVLLDAPTDVNDGDVFSMIIDVTRFFYSSPISPYTHSFEVTLPPGVMFSGSLSDIVILKANGMPYTITPTIGYDPMTNKITFTFTNVNPMQDKMKILFNNLMAVCAKGGGGAIMVDAYMMTNPMCSCNPHTLCVNRSIQLHCPIPCPRGGMYNRDFSMTRTNIGLLDNDNNGIPDSPQGTQSPFVRDNYAIHCDTFESEFTGIVVIGPDSPPEGFIYGYAIDSSQTAAKLIPLSGKVIITRPGGTTFTCTNIPVGSTGLYHYANFSISNLASCGYGPTFVGGDTVRTYITYAVSDANRYSGVFQYPVKTRYYLSNVDYRDTPFSSTTNLQMYYCDNYSGEFGLVGLYDASNGQRNLTHQSCDTLETIMDYFLGVGPSQYYSGGNFFTNEYRPISYYDTLRITVPAGYTYHRATVAYNYNGVQKLVSITPIDVNANPLVFVITNLFEINGGTLPIADEGHYIQFRTYMVASCLATPSNTININMRQRSIPIGKYDHLVTAANKLYSSTNVISYNKPNISISSAEPIVQAATDTVSWDITLTNTTPFPANNVWFGEVAGGSIEFIQAQQINCTTGALIGSVLTDNGMGVYETGTLNGNSQRCYRVTGRITSCMTNDLTISSGWNCGAYPETTPEAICDSELLLRATLLESGLNIQIVNQPLTAVELCDTITYEIIISNPNVGRTEDVIVGFTIPGGVDGVEIIPNSSFLRFPASTGTYPASPNLLDPIVNGINYEWVIPNSIIGGSGLDGTLDAPENQFRLRFKARTVPCDIRSGIRFFFNARGMSPCGVPVEATQQATQRINLVGSLGAAGAFVVNTEVGMPKYCIQDSTTIDVNLLYIGSVATDGNELVSLTIPAHYQIVSGSYVATGAPAPTSGPTPAGMVVDGNVYQLSLPAGITIGDEINFSLQISKVDTAVCMLDPVILTETSRVFQATCSSDLGIMCDIVEVSGDDRDTMTILPAVLSFNGPLDTTIVCSLLSIYLSSDGGYTINDACGNVTITSEIITSPPCLIDGDYSVRWISIDDCGNRDTIVITLTVIDTVPPVISGVPNDITVTCASDVPPIPPTSTITVMDDCALMHTVTIVDEVTNLVCANKYTLLRHFIATNECGRMDTLTQTITVNDNIKPLWMTLPQDLFVECSDPNRTTIINNWLAAFGNAMSFDNCNGPVTITMTAGLPVSTCGGSTTTVYNVTADDGCGNSITAYADLVIFDDTPPTLVPPVDITIACTDNLSTSLSSWFATTSATDGCGGTVSLTQTLISDVESCSGNITLRTLTYLFTATDACGNVSTATRTLTVRDNVSPVITAPTNLSLTCGQPMAAAILAWLDDYTVTEACQDYTVTNNYTGTLPNTCGGSMTITWTVTDGCGATGTTSAMVIVANDTTPPVFSNCPSAMTVNVDVDICGANVIYSTPIATDCNSPVSVSLVSGPASGTTFPLGASTITFRTTDACGNTADCSFVITVVDSDIPSVQCPSNAVNACAGTTCTWTSDASIAPIYNDNCAGSTISYVISGATTVGTTTGSAVGTVFNLGISTVTYTVTNNGLSASCSFQVVVSDCTPPTITCPADLVLECADPDIALDIAAWNATATDNCDTDVSIVKTLINTVGQCGNSEIRLYRFVATDNVGNTSVCYANVIIEDTTIPSITTAAISTNVECDGNGNYSQLISWLNNHAGAVATDACGSLSWSNNFSGISDQCGNTGSVMVVFTVTDECGNTNSTTATYTIQDTQDPTIAVPDDITLQCGDPANDAIIANWLNAATGTDMCGSVTISNDYPGTEGAANCTSEGSLTVTWTATDACGADITATSTISFSDTRKPVLMNPPSDLVLECTNPDLATLISAWVLVNGNGMAVDACDASLTITFTAGTSVPLCGGTSTTPYTYTATDDCGNSISAYANLIIHDNTGPVLSLPTATSTIACDGDVSTTLNTWLTSATATDDCGGTTTITYALIGTEEICDGTETNVLHIYQFSAFDQCGNVTTAIDTFEVLDDVSPIIVAPVNLTVSCGQDIGAAILAWIDDFTVTEACQDFEVTNDFTGSVGSLCGGMTTVTWTVTDACGATGSSSAMIIVTDDLTPPVFANCPGNLFVNVDVDVCGANVIYSTPVANDCNGPVNVVLSAGIASGSLFPLGATTIEFTATDACGNESTCSFIITVEDSDIPQVFCPSNDVVVCTDLDACTWTATNAVNPLGIENCPNAQIEFSTTGATTLTGTTTAAGQIFNLGTTIVTYTITDGSSNVSSCSFNVVVEDCQAPTIDCSDELNIACGDEDLGAWFDAIAATAADNCSTSANLAVDTLLLTDFFSCGNTFHRVYLYTVTDQAGNTATCTATYSTIDTIPPVIDNAAVVNLTVECNDISNGLALIGWLNNHAGLTATDVCAEPVTWTHNFNGSLSDLCGNTGAVTVVFTATDACGNTSTESAIYTIQDTTDPVISCPPNITIECNSPNQQAIINTWLSTASATDECDESVNVTNNFSSAPFVSSCGSTGVYTVTFTATDDCNNVITCERTITLSDSRPPVLTIMAIDTIVECGPNNSLQLTAWLNNHAGATATDGCSALGQLVWQTPELIQTIDGCGNTVVYLYRFRVADACGNLSAWTIASFTIKDETSPAISTIATDETVECDGGGNLEERNLWLNNHGGAIASDICGPDAIWTYTLINVIDQCGFTGTYTYRFTVTDACGNTSTTDASFIIEDTTAPNISTPAVNITAQCNGANNSAEILNWLNNNGFADASESCGNIIWTNDYGTINSDCGTTGGVTVTFTATDQCGNATTTSAVFTIIDDIAPAWEIYPQNLTIECNGMLDPFDQINAWLNTVGGAEAEDSCSLVVYTNDFVALTGGCSEFTGSALVTFTATDACGNSVTATATLTVVDVTGPEFVIMARDTTVECDGTGNTVDLATWLANHGGAVAADECSEPLVWDYTLIGTTQGCGNTSSSRYSFTATDACGNTSVTTEALFIIEDTTAPVFLTPPSDSIVQCDGSGNLSQLSGWLGANANITTEDVCAGNVSITYDLVRETDLCGLTGSGLYRFTISDACNNSTFAEASFIIVDTIPPAITGGADMNMEECIAPPAGNYPEFDFWLTNHAGATAADICGGYSWSNNYQPSNWVQQCGNTRYVDVTFYATDICGNVDSITHKFSIGDITPPVFTNCPRPPVIVDAPEGWCSSYVNFSPMAATDNCSAVTINQIDTTGLESGSLFPVGLTILIYEAVDQCGNKDTCQIKIVVNDFHTPPSITCPEDVIAVNDLGMCGAIVNNIAPVSVVDNCPDNTAVTYVVKDSLNNILLTGVEDASGEKFIVGRNDVTYTVTDQPILLITEVLQNGVISGVEIGNFGPASYNISCLTIRRTTSGINEDFIVPNGTIVGVGAVYTHNFSLIPAGQTATYSILFLDRVIDAITVNSGLLVGTDFYRCSVEDTDAQSDFKVADLCHTGSFGVWNPQLPIFTDNGTTTSLQSEDPSEASCTFTIRIKDIEAPSCAMHDTLDFTQTNIILNTTSCITSTVVVGSGIVDDVNIEDLLITIGNVGAIQAYLTSPSGTQIKLFGNVCEGTANVNVSLDDLATNSIVSAPCGPLGNAGTYKPLQPFKTFFGEPSGGTWTLSVYLDSNTSGTINNWTLQILNTIPYAQQDTVIANAPGECNADFMWVHPVFNDNCCVGSMTVTYEFFNAITGEQTFVRQEILSENGIMNLDGTKLTRNFNVGVTTIRYTLIDQYGNEAECSFTVTVEDREDPVFPFGCKDRSIQLAPGECFASFGETPVNTDNCGVASVSYCDADGNPFDITQVPIGSHEITVKVTDIYGNVGSCTFTYDVFEYNTTNNTLACNNSVNISLGSDCTAVIDPDMILEGGPYRCYENYCITITDLSGNPHPNLFTTADEGKTFIVSISDCLNSNNSCWGYVKIENKLVPIITCPANVTLACNEDPLAIDEDSILVTGVVVIESCAPGAKISYADYLDNNGTCSNPRATLTRRWSVLAANGHLATCDQIITFEGFDINDVVFPDHFNDENALSCSDVAHNPNLTKPENTGYPTINDRPIFGKHYCDINVGYNDQILQDANCPSAYEILRFWFIRNECQPVLLGVNPIIYLQSIKVDDNDAPLLNELPDVTIGTDPWKCSGKLVLPDPVLTDKCSMYSVKWIVNYGNVQDSIISDLQKGVTVVTAKVSDMCGNIARKSFNVTVIDATPPIAIAKQNLVLSLTGSTGIDGAAKLYAHQLDNGSYDNCSEVRFEVRRADGGSCGNVGANGTHNNNSTYNNNNGYPSEVPGAVWFHPQDNAQDTDGGEFVKFCCEDIPAGSEFGLHDVELRVWDDGNMNGIYGDNDIINGMKDNYNTTWVTVRVENKLAPVLVCPPDVTVTCDMELNLSLDADTNVNDVDLTMTGYPQAYDLCTNLETTYKDQWVGSHDPVCKAGTIRRTFKVTKGPVVVNCSQFITVSTITVPFTVTFPNQGQTTEWDKCSFNLSDAQDASNPSIKRPIVNHGQCDIVGENIKIDTFLFEDGACKKWKVTYSYKNWCTGEEINTIAGLPIVHWYAFKDEIAPVLSCTNQMFAANPNPQNPNGGCEAQVVLEAFAKDSLICAEESWIKWQMFFDGWNDGTVDRLGSSFVNKSWNGIWVPQAKFISGVPNPTWTALQNQHPNLPLADLVYVTYIKPTAASGGTAKLPVGTGATAFILNAENISHKVTWKITDGCGNVDQCESTVMVVDKKAPTPYCLSVSTAIMQTNPQMVELWAKDFDKGAFDNCSPQNKLYFTFDGAAPIYARVNEEHFYKVVGGISVNATAAEYAQGKAYKWLPSARSAGFVWTAAGDYNVQVNVWDEAWNTDYCNVTLSVRVGTGSTISGTVATEGGQGVSEVTVIVEANVPEYPKSVLTDQNGLYTFDVLTGNDYVVRAQKDGDYLNGVSTLDMVQIQRHILGIQLFDSNYKLLAADVNNDGKVTASDLTELRKLILGITPVLPKNTSWRFPVAGVAVNATPISCVEKIEINNMATAMEDQDFVAVKIGDVNGSVSKNVNTPNVEARSKANVEMRVDEATLEQGDVIEIPVTSDNFYEVMGFQFTMNLNGATFVGIQRGVLDVSASNIGIISNNVITMSYASNVALTAQSDAVLFTLTVKADRTTKVSDIFSLNSQITRAESYNNDFKVGSISLSTRTMPSSEIVLFQNEPNPFKGLTTIRFEMPKAATATLSVYDVTGKLITVRNIDAIKGMNSEIFTKDQLGISGTLYYTLVSGDFTATKKMIVVE